MDHWVSKSGPSSTPDGAFERFLTAAIATIITIMFSWRLLDEEERKDEESDPGRHKFGYSSPSSLSSSFVSFSSSYRDGSSATPSQTGRQRSDLTAGPLHRHQKENEVHKVPSVDDTSSSSRVVPVAVGYQLTNLKPVIRVPVELPLCGDEQDSSVTQHNPSGLQFGGDQQKRENNSIPSRSGSGYHPERMFNSQIEDQNDGVSNDASNSERADFSHNTNNSFEHAQNDCADITDSSLEDVEFVGVEDTSDLFLNISGDSNNSNSRDEYRHIINNDNYRPFRVSADNDTGENFVDKHNDGNYFDEDDAEPRELDSDEELFCCSVLEPITEEDSDDLTSSSEGDNSRESTGVSDRKHKEVEYDLEYEEGKRGLKSDGNRFAEKPIYSVKTSANFGANRHSGVLSFLHEPTHSQRPITHFSSSRIRDLDKQEARFTGSLAARPDYEAITSSGADWPTCDVGTGTHDGPSVSTVPTRRDFGVQATVFHTDDYYEYIRVYGSSVDRFSPPLLNNPIVTISKDSEKEKFKSVAAEKNLAATNKDQVCVPREEELGQVSQDSLSVSPLIRVEDSSSGSVAPVVINIIGSVSEDIDVKPINGQGLISGLRPIPVRTKRPVSDGLVHAHKKRKSDDEEAFFRDRIVSEGGGVAFGEEVIGEGARNQELLPDGGSSDLDGSSSFSSRVESLSNVNKGDSKASISGLGKPGKVSQSTSGADDKFRSRLELDRVLEKTLHEADKRKDNLDEIDNRRDVSSSGDAAVRSPSASSLVRTSSDSHFRFVNSRSPRERIQKNSMHKMDRREYQDSFDRLSDRNDVSIRRETDEYETEYEEEVVETYVLPMSHERTILRTLQSVKDLLDQRSAARRSELIPRDDEDEVDEARESTCLTSMIDVEGHDEMGFRGQDDVKSGYRESYDAVARTDRDLKERLGFELNLDEYKTDEYNTESGWPIVRYIEKERFFVEDNIVDDTEYDRDMETNMGTMREMFSDEDMNDGQQEDDVEDGHHIPREMEIVTEEEEEQESRGPTEDKDDDDFEDDDEWDAVEEEDGRGEEGDGERRAGEEERYEAEDDEYKRDYDEEEYTREDDEEEEKKEYKNLLQDYAARQRQETQFNVNQAKSEEFMLVTHKQTSFPKRIPIPPADDFTVVTPHKPQFERSPSEERFAKLEYGDVMSPTIRVPVPKISADGTSTDSRLLPSPRDEESNSDRVYGRVPAAQSESSTIPRSPTVSVPTGQSSSFTGDIASDSRHDDVDYEDFVREMSFKNDLSGPQGDIYANLTPDIGSAILSGNLATPYKQNDVFIFPKEEEHEAIPNVSSLKDEDGKSSQSEVKGAKRSEESESKDEQIAPIKKPRLVRTSTAQDEEELLGFKPGLRRSSSSSLHDGSTGFLNRSFEETSSNSFALERMDSEPGVFGRIKSKEDLSRSRSREAIVPESPTIEFRNFPESPRKSYPPMSFPEPVLDVVLESAVGEQGRTGSNSTDSAPSTPKAQDTKLTPPPVIWTRVIPGSNFLEEKLSPSSDRTSSTPTSPPDSVDGRQRKTQISVKVTQEDSLDLDFADADDIPDVSTQPSPAKTSPLISPIKTSPLISTTKTSPIISPTKTSAVTSPTKTSPTTSLEKTLPVNTALNVTKSITSSKTSQLSSTTKTSPLISPTKTSAVTSPTNTSPTTSVERTLPASTAVNIAPAVTPSKTLPTASPAKTLPAVTPVLTPPAISSSKTSPTSTRPEIPPTTTLTTTTPTISPTISSPPTTPTKHRPVPQRPNYPPPRPPLAPKPRTSLSSSDSQTDIQKTTTIITDTVLITERISHPPKPAEMSASESAQPKPNAPQTIPQSATDSKPHQASASLKTPTANAQTIPPSTPARTLPISSPSKPQPSVNAQQIISPAAPIEKSIPALTPTKPPLAPKPRKTSLSSSKVEIVHIVTTDRMSPTFGIDRREERFELFSPEFKRIELTGKVEVLEHERMEEDEDFRDGEIDNEVSEEETESEEETDDEEGSDSEEEEEREEIEVDESGTSEKSSDNEISDVEKSEDKGHSSTISHRLEITDDVFSQKPKTTTSLPTFSMTSSQSTFQQVSPTISSASVSPSTSSTSPGNQSQFTPGSPKKPRSMKEIKKRYKQPYKSVLTQEPTTPTSPKIAPFVLPENLLTPSRLKIIQSRNRFLSEQNLLSDPFAGEFAAHKEAMAKVTAPVRDRKYTPKMSKNANYRSQEQLEKIMHMISLKHGRSEGSLHKAHTDCLHDDCILSEKGRRDILDKALSIDNLHTDLYRQLQRFDSETDMHGGSMGDAFFPETNSDLFDLTFPFQGAGGRYLERPASMSELRHASDYTTISGAGSGYFDPPGSKGKGRFTQRQHKKSKSLCTLETNLDDDNFVTSPTSDSLQRVPSAHELRISKSLQKLNVPNWYKQSSLSKSGSCLLKYGSNSSMSSWAFSPSLISSPCTTPSTTSNVVIRSRVQLPTSSRNLRSPHFTSKSAPTTPSLLNQSEEEKPATPTPIKLPSEKMRTKDKPKSLMPIPIVPFDKIRAMFEKTNEGKTQTTRKEEIPVSLASPLPSVAKPQPQRPTQISPSKKFAVNGSESNDVEEVIPKVVVSPTDPNVKSILKRPTQEKRYSDIRESPEADDDSVIIKPVPTKPSESAPTMTLPQAPSLVPPQPQKQQPAITQPQKQQPVITQPQKLQPAITQPQKEQRAITQSQKQQPAITQPQKQQPAITQPQKEQPAITQPQKQQSAIKPPIKEKPAPPERSKSGDIKPQATSVEKKQLPIYKDDRTNAKPQKEDELQSPPVGKSKGFSFFKSLRSSSSSSTDDGKDKGRKSPREKDIKPATSPSISPDSSYDSPEAFPASPVSRFSPPSTKSPPTISITPDSSRPKGSPYVNIPEGKLGGSPNILESSPTTKPVGQKPFTTPVIEHQIIRDTQAQSLKQPPKEVSVRNTSSPDSVEETNIDDSYESPMTPPSPEPTTPEPQPDKKRSWFPKSKSRTTKSPEEPSKISPKTKESELQSKFEIQQLADEPRRLRSPTGSTNSRDILPQERTKPGYSQHESDHSRTSESFVEENRSTARESDLDRSRDSYSSRSADRSREFERDYPRDSKIPERKPYTEPGRSLTRDLDRSSDSYSSRSGDRSREFDRDYPRDTKIPERKHSVESDGSLPRDHDRSRDSYSSRSTDRSREFERDYPRDTKIPERRPSVESDRSLPRSLDRPPPSYSSLDRGSIRSGTDLGKSASIDDRIRSSREERYSSSEDDRRGGSRDRDYDRGLDSRDGRDYDKRGRDYDQHRDYDRGDNDYTSRESGYRRRDVDYDDPDVRDRLGRDPDRKEPPSRKDKDWSYLEDSTYSKGSESDDSRRVGEFDRNSKFRGSAMNYDTPRDARIRRPSDNYEDTTTSRASLSSGRSWQPKSRGSRGSDSSPPKRVASAVEEKASSSRQSVDSNGTAANSSPYKYRVAGSAFSSARPNVVTGLSTPPPERHEVGSSSKSDVSVGSSKSLRETTV